MTWQKKLDNMAKVIYDEFQKNPTATNLRRLLEDTLKLNLLGVEEAAVYLGMNPKTLKKQAWLGKVPRVKLGKFVKFHIPTLNKWVEDNIEEAKKAPGRRRGRGKELYIKKEVYEGVGNS